MKIVIYGTGVAAKELHSIINTYYKDIEIVGFTRTNILCDEEKTYLDIKLCPNSNLPEQYDYLVIATWDMKCLAEIKDICLHKIGIEKEKVIWHIDFLKRIRKSIVMNKIEKSNDPELQDIFCWLKNHELTTRNPYVVKDKKMYEVFWDKENGYPYVEYFGHRMYYPKQYEFIKQEGKTYLVNIWEGDQFEGSPHKYETDNHKVEKGDIVVDAGVAEGNFVLKYIDIIDKAYLIEPDPIWLEVLKITFESFMDKIEIIPKYLGHRDSDKEITLDTLIGNRKVDFIKMDIEGSEILALLGGKNVLKNNNAKISACAYHKARDEEYISFLLESLGYTISHSAGYMFFNLDKDIDRTLDFRRGVIYGYK